MRRRVTAAAAVHCFVDDDATGGGRSFGHPGLSGPGIFELASRGLVPKGSVTERLLLHGGGSGGGPRNRGAGLA